MEEKKKAKTVRMANGKDIPQEKISYEELEKVASNLNQQCKAMYQKLQEAEHVISNFNDIGMLLSILKQSEYFDDSFTSRCARKVQDTVTAMLDSVEKED